LAKQLSLIEASATADTPAGHAVGRAANDVGVDVLALVALVDGLALALCDVALSVSKS
jgi:hypothetical protein